MLMHMRCFLLLSLVSSAHSFIIQESCKELIAILITGTETRFVQANKVEQLIKPLVDKGCRVDVYIQLVALGHEAGTRFALFQQPATHTFTAFQESIRAAGARLLHAELLQGQPELRANESVINERGRAHPELHKVMWQYSPLSSNARERTIGLNVLRRYASLEALMAKSASVEETEHFTYDLFLVTRDDDYWMNSLDLTNVKDDPNKTISVYSKDCFPWLGINDKTLLFGRAAMHSIITKFTHIFIDPELETTFRNNEIYNAESALKVLVSASGMKSKLLPSAHIPTVLAVSDESNAASVCLRAPVEDQGEPVDSSGQPKCQGAPSVNLPWCSRHVLLNADAHGWGTLAHQKASRMMRRSIDSKALEVRLQ